MLRLVYKTIQSLMLYYFSGWFECVCHGIMPEIVFLLREHNGLIIVLQYSYGKSSTAILRIVLQYSCAVHSLGGNTIFICLPLSGGCTLHFTLHCSPYYCQCHHHHHFCSITPSFLPRVIYLSFHFLISKSSTFIWNRQNSRTLNHGWGKCKLQAA